MHGEGLGNNWKQMLDHMSFTSCGGSAPLRYRPWIMGRMRASRRLRRDWILCALGRKYVRVRIVSDTSLRYIATAELSYDVRSQGKPR